MMKKVMHGAVLASFLLTVLFAALHFAEIHWAQPAVITFGTCLYHFAMRILVGHSVNQIMANKADYHKSWYQPKPFESKLYRILRVKRWKGKMPAYTPGVFDPDLHSWDEIAQAMCQAEIVHELIVVLSFIPLLFAIPFGAFPVFVITSLLSAMFDLSFVIMQRYNRPRIIQFIKKERVS